MGWRSYFAKMTKRTWRQTLFWGRGGLNYLPTCFWLIPTKYGGFHWNKKLMKHEKFTCRYTHSKINIQKELLMLIISYLYHSNMTFTYNATQDHTKQKRKDNKIARNSISSFGCYQQTCWLGFYYVYALRSSRHKN